MKKFASAALLAVTVMLSAVLLSLSGCSGKAVRFASSMFDRARVTLNASRIGLIMDQEPIGSKEERSYFVTFREDGSYEKVIFTFTTTDEYSDGSKTVTQDEIEGIPDKLHVTAKFIFLSFTINELNPAFSEIYPDYNLVYYSDDDNKAFAIDKETGKMYSLNDFACFSVVGESVISVSELDLTTYYHMSIKDGDLILTDLLPNKNILPTAIVDDRYGNVFVENNQTESVSGQYHYVKNAPYKGDDGHCYTVQAGDGQSNFGSKYIEREGLTLCRVGSAGEPEALPQTPVLLEFYDPENYNFRRKDNSFYLLNGEELYYYSENGLFYYRNSPESERFLFRAYKGLMFRKPDAPGIPEHKLKYFYLFDHSVLVGELSDGVYYYDLFSKKLSPDSSSMEFENCGKVTETANLYTEKGGVFYKREEVQGTNVYELTVTEDRKVISVLSSEIDYPVTVITIQPLN